jgi:hypothetical protein
VAAAAVTAMVGTVAAVVGIAAAAVEAAAAVAAAAGGTSFRRRVIRVRGFATVAEIAGAEAPRNLGAWTAPSLL